MLVITTDDDESEPARDRRRWYLLKMATRDPDSLPPVWKSAREVAREHPSLLGQKPTTASFSEYSALAGLLDE